MSDLATNTSLSRSARLLCYLGPPSTILLTAFASPKTALLSPLAFLHTGLFYRKWRQLEKVDPSRRGELEPMIWTYVVSGTLGLVAVSLVQGITGYALSTMLFGSGEERTLFLKEAMRSSIEGLSSEQISTRMAIAHSWQNWAFNAAFMSAVGLFEEGLKYLPIEYARRRYSTEKDGQKRNRAYLDLVLSSALSFGLVEGIGFLYTACEQQQQSWPILLRTLFERLLLGSTGHLLVATLTALRATRRDFYGAKMSCWAVVGPSALLHSAQNFVALSLSASEGNPGWIHPSGVRKSVAMIGMAIAMMTQSAGLIIRERAMIEEQDRKQH